MTLSAGTALSASVANRFQPIEYFATATVDLPASSTDVDITGATITFMTQTANAAYTVEAVFDMDLTGATTSIMRGKCVVDGTTQAAEAIYEAAVTTDRSTVSQQWKGTLPSAGAHTIKLRGTIPATTTIRATHTNLLVRIREVI